MDIIVAQLLREFADALGCAPDNEVILAEIDRLKRDRDEWRRKALQAMPSAD